MSAGPYVPWFHGDFLRSTVGWTLLERAACWMLICAQWEIGPLPTDPARLASIVGIDVAQMTELWAVVGQKFPPNLDGRGGLLNPRLEEHRARVERYRQSLSDAGKKGMQSRWGKRKKAPKKTPATAVAMPEPEPPPGLDTAAWERWKEYRHQIGKAIKAPSISAAQRQLAHFGAQQREVVERSIASGYQGLFAPNDGSGTKPTPPRRLPPDAYDVASGRPKVVV